jgi:hypothetical protein
LPQAYDEARRLSHYYKGDDGVTRAYTRIFSDGITVDTIAVSLIVDQVPAELPLSLRLGEPVCKEGN